MGATETRECAATENFDTGGTELATTPDLPIFA